MTNAVGTTTDRPRSVFALNDRFLCQLRDAATLIVLVFFSSGAGVTLIGLGDANYAELQRQMWWPIYALIAILAFPRSHISAPLLLRAPAVSTLLVLACASVLWSIEPMTTARRVLALGVTTLVGLDLAARYSPREQLRLLSGAMSIGLLMGVAAALVLPELGRMPDGAWRGVLVDKNGFGRFAVLTMLCVTLTHAFTTRERIVAVLVVVLGCVALVGSNSVTALMTAAAILGVFVLLRALIASPIAGAGMLSMTGAIAVVLAVWGRPIAEASLAQFGRNLSMTGRTEVWDEVLYLISSRPLLGHGYDAFWASQSELGDQVSDSLLWTVPNAHSGLLEIALGLGVVGAALFVIAYGRVFVVSMYRALRIGSDRCELFGPLFLVFLAIASFGESILLLRHSILWIVFVALAVRSARRTPEAVS